MALPYSMAIPYLMTLTLSSGSALCYVPNPPDFALSYGPALLYGHSLSYGSNPNPNPLPYVMSPTLTPLALP